MFINNFVDLYFIKGFVLSTIENFSRIFLFYFLIGFNSLHLNSLYDHLFLFFKFESPVYVVLSTLLFKLFPIKDELSELITVQSI